MNERPRTIEFALSTKGFTFDLHFSRLGETTSVSIAVIPRYPAFSGALPGNLSASVTRHKGKGGDVENPAAGMRYALVKATEGQMGRAVRKQFFAAYDTYIGARPTLPNQLLPLPQLPVVPTLEDIDRVYGNPAPALTTLHPSVLIGPAPARNAITNARYEELLFKERQLEALQAGYRVKVSPTGIEYYHSITPGRRSVVYQKGAWRRYARFDEKLPTFADAVNAWTRAA